MNTQVIKDRIEQSIEVKKRILEDNEIVRHISIVAEKMIQSIDDGGKIILCGNGGSASDAMHFAGELVGRFQRERESWPAIVLNSDPVAMSSIANDYDYNEVFSRQMAAFAHREDIFMGISTSGNSENVIRAVAAAKERSTYTVGLLGRGGGRLASLVDLPIIVPSDVTARVQESHIVIIHILCELIEEALYQK